MPRRTHRLRNVALVFLCLAALLVVTGLMLKPKSGPARIQAQPSLVGISAGGSYAWILRTGSGAVLIDAGMDAKGKAILAELQTEGLTADSVHAIFLTHGHADHWAAAALFPNAVTYLGPGDRGWLLGTTVSRSAVLRTLSRLFPHSSLPAHLVELRGDEAAHPDGETIQVVRLPGHTEGSLAFLWKDTLFTGDSLLKKDDAHYRLSPSFFSDDPAQNLESLQVLKSLRFTQTADGHAGLMTDAKPKLEAFLGAATPAAGGSGSSRP